MQFGYSNSVDNIIPKLGNSFSQYFGENYYEDWNFNKLETITLSSGSIESITSIGVNGRNMVSSIGQIPSSIYNSSLGKYVAEFDGVSELLNVNPSGTDYDFLHNGDGGCVIAVFSESSEPATTSLLLSNTWTQQGFRMQTNGSSACSSVVRDSTSLIAVQQSSNNAELNKFNARIDVFDADNATLSERISIDLNGIESATNITSGTASVLPASKRLTIGKRVDAASFYFDGLVARIIIIKTVPTPQQILWIKQKLKSEYGNFPIL
jgi:hypothetical protein